MKRILIYLGHPAHYHLFKNTVKNLMDAGNDVKIIIKTKDILENLLQYSNLAYYNLLQTRRNGSKYSIIAGEVKKHKELYKLCKRYKPDIMVGTSSAIPLIGKLLNIPSVNINEDDADVVPLYAIMSYPLSTEIITPSVCNNGRWNCKSIKYDGYHELAYLNPNYFKPDLEVVSQYVPKNEPYYLLRFSKLDAHHDEGIKGLNHTIAENIVNILKNYGRVYITSEREIDPAFEPYRIAINPLEIHHIIAYAQLFIGDSQTMAAEAGVLGTPFIRFNDFVGKIGYLKELEEKYELGYGIKPANVQKLFQKIDELMNIDDMGDVFKAKRDRMLKDKIDVTAFFTWFIKNYPESSAIMKKNPSYQLNFSS